MRNHFPLDHEQKLGCNGCIQTNPPKTILKQSLCSAKSCQLCALSISQMNWILKNQITVSPEGYLYLTESGLATAEKIYERHLFLSEWLEKLGVNPVVAASDACKIEHVISSESFAAIKKHIDLDSMK